MTPKEKAVELYEKYFYIIPSNVDSYFSDGFALKSALLAVDELLSVMEYPSEQYSFYLEVKKEIEKL